MAELEGYEDVDLDAFDDDGRYVGNQAADTTNDVPDTIEAVSDAPTGDDTPPATTPSGWEWTEGLNPEHVQRSWDKFTQSMQEVAEKERALAPYQQLYDEVSSNPELQAYIRQFFENGGNVVTQTPQGFDPKVVELEQKLNAMEFQRGLDLGMAKLHETVASEGLPQFENDKLLDYMAEHQIPDPETAYYRMTYRDAIKMASERTLDDIKKNRGAALPTAPKGDATTKKTSGTSMNDIMDDDNFFNNYGSLLRELTG